MERYFSSLAGVTGTQVGYTGGSSANPTYHNLDGHSESIEITYDPAKITYRELLHHFWGFRDHSGVYATQYESAIFTTSDEQMTLALASREEQPANKRRPLRVRIEPAGMFYRGEEYHQQYYGKIKARV